MENLKNQQAAAKRRIRNDKLVGFRLEKHEYQLLRRALQDNATSISDYLRGLVVADLRQRNALDSATAELATTN